MGSIQTHSVAVDVMEQEPRGAGEVTTSAEARPSISEVADKILSDLLSDDPTEFLKANQQSSGQ